MTQTAILFLHALSGLHPGSGTALGVVDLPVQRERHTQWPTIPASSVKGVLRDACRRHGMDKGTVATLFGPETANADKHAGALATSDARVLAFPVRSLSGVFAWTTCPAAWGRLVRDGSMLARVNIPKPPARVSDGIVHMPKDSAIQAGSDVVLEEFAFKPDGDVTPHAEWLAGRAVTDEGTAGRLRRALAMIPDDDFTYFVRHATEVTARIGLDYQSKTVRDGALFYEEFLPPETLFYVLIFADDSRNKDEPMSAADVLGRLKAALPPVLQLGSGETIGKGLCATRLVTDREFAS
jgi:CRISPR-associated protein Cmr4